MPPSPTSVQYALITGASKGIGKAIAFELAGRGHSVILAARSGDLLETIAQEIRTKHPVQVRTLPVDLAKPGAAQYILEFCEKEQLDVNILINNAGFGANHSVEKGTPAEWNEMVQVNVLAAQQLCQAFIPMLRKNKPAWILNVSSMASYQPVPWMTVYAATKAYLTSFSRGLRTELMGTGITVCCFCPNGVFTEFGHRAGNQDIVEKTKLFHITAEKAAQISVRKMLKGRAEFVPRWYNNLAVFLVKMLPKSMSISSSARIFKKD